MGELLAVGGALAAATALAGLEHLRRPLRTGQTGDLRLHTVAPDVYLWRGYFSNAAVLALPGQLVVVDTLASPQLAARMRRDLQTQLARPVGCAVLTHFHGDHVGGTSQFADVPRYASAPTATAMATRDGERAAYARNFGLIVHELPPVLPPTVTFSGDAFDLDVGGEKLQLLHLGAAETDDAVVVWWPQRRVLACGDSLATAGFPFSGAPICDEGLRADGHWLACLQRLRDLEPEVVLPGHGPPLVGRQTIRDRIDRVADVFASVISVVREEMARGDAVDAVDAVVQRSLARLARFHKQADLPQNAISMRMTVLRAFHALSPQRHGHGWWHDLGPRCLAAPLPEQALELLAQLSPGPAVRAEARRLADRRQYGRVRDLLWAAAARDPQQAHDYLGDCAWWMVAAARRAPVAYEGADGLVEAGKAATRALELDTHAATAALALGTLEVLSAIMLGQPMDRGQQLLASALASGKLEPSQAQAASFFLGKAHQFEEREGEADRWLRAAMPGWSRVLYPLFREKLRAIP